MKRILIVLTAALGCIIAHAYTFNYSFKDTPIAEALTRIIRNHPELEISFIYNELEGYKTNTVVRSDNAADAIRQLVSYNPVSVMVIDGQIFVEALQKGKYRYAGRVVDEHGETVPFATVMLLAPKDSAVVTYGTTDTEGCFSIPCDRRNVVAKFSGVGYRTRYSRCEGFNLGDVMLASSAINLKGVTVEAPNSYVTSDRSVYTPTRRQKRVSQDATDLLKVMAIPEISIDPFSNSVKDNFGNSVPIYINYMPASGYDLSGMRMADVRRVEFLYAPTDSRFRGARSVINFIMDEYEYGGYTKGTLKENFLVGLMSGAGIFSKFSYKKMTYDLYAAAKNQNDRHNGNSTEAVYSLKDDSGNPYTARRVEKMDDSHFIQNQYPFTFRATYSGKKVQIRNTVGFTHLWKPENTESGNLIYQPSVGKDHEYSRAYTKRNNSFSYSGNWFFVLPDEFSLNLTPKANCSFLRDNDNYSSTIAEPVVRNADEKAYSLRLDMNLNKKFDKGNSVSLDAAVFKSYNNVRYSGSSNSGSRYDMTAAFGGLSYNLETGPLSLSADIALVWERNTINGKDYDDLYPGSHLHLGYAFNRSNRVNLNAQFASFTPELSNKTPNILKKNELMYVTGNPALKNYRVYNLGLGYTWMPAERFKANVFSSYEGFSDRMKTVYSEYDGGKALLRSYLNDGNSHRLYTGFKFSWSLPDRNLMISASPEWDFYRITGLYSRTLNTMIFSGSASYYLGDFYFEGRYKTRVKNLNPETGVIQRGRDRYTFSAGWGNGDLNIRLTAYNIFTKDWLRYTREFTSPLYSESRRVYAPTFHQTLNLSVVYTFGYGRKLKRGNEVGEQSGAGSAILK